MTRTSALLACVAGLALIAGPATAADPAAVIIDRYVAWRGGPAFERATGVHATGTATDGRFGGPVERWITAGHGRDRFAFGALTSDSAYGPDGAWTVTLSGQIEAPSAAEVDAARRRDLLTFDDALRGAGGATITLAPPEIFDGAPVSVLHVTFGGPDAYDLLIDPTSGALRAERRLEDGRKTLVRYDDWRIVEGVRMPFAERLQEEGDPIERRLAFTAMDIDPAVGGGGGGGGARPPAAGGGGGRGGARTALDIDPAVARAVWARPAPRQVVQFAPGVQATAPLPFEFFLGSRIYIPATVAGQATHVLLDSGAETTVLDSRFAEAAGIEVSGVVTAVGTGGRQEAHLASGVTIRIGEVELRDLTVALVDLSSIEQAIGRPIPVILGKEVLNALTVDLDFQGKTIAFADPARFTPPAGAVEVPVTSANGIRSVPVSIEGGPPVAVDFDLGNGSAFLAYSAWWKPAGTLSDGRPVSKTISGAIGGMKTRSIASLRAVTFAGVTFHDVPTVFFDDDGQSAESNRTLGNIGMPILSRFRLTTDYSRNRLFLTPLPDAATRPFSKDRSGVLARPAREGKAEVLMIAPGSPAEAAGLKAGQILTAINGLALTGDNASAIQALRALPAGSSVSFTLSTGETRTIVLKDYF